MFRQPLVPCVWLGAALGLVAAIAPVTVLGQDRSAYERLDRLERDLNMLQRQVYRGGPSPTGGGNANAEIRMDHLETQMRELTGRVEEVMHQVEQVRQRIEQMNNDLGVRMAQAPPGPGPVALATPPASRPGSAAPAARGRLPYPPALAPAVSPDGDGGPLLPPGAEMAPGGPMGGPYAGPPGGPTPIFGTLTPPGAAPPSRSTEVASAAPAGRPPDGGTLPGSASDQYNYAFGLLKQANYPAAEEALKAFIDAYPKDPMAGNAQFWLGETYFSRNRFMEAATTFAEGYKRFPKGSKAPDSLLKLGMSLARANQKQNACVALVQLDHDFPQVGAAIKERAAAEKKKLGC